VKGHGEVRGEVREDNSMTATQEYSWQSICAREDLVPGSGVCALIGREQVALFYLPEEEPQLYAMSNRDPIGDASVLSRGVVGDIGGRLVVASPLYKQHFDLLTGVCLEQEEVQIAVYRVRFEGDTVLVAL
jgi:nitrite reductase (NADH) small subunit